MPTFISNNLKKTSLDRKHKKLLYIYNLQILGFEVDAINSVQFSNHTGYKKFGGQVLTETDLRELIECLKANELDNYTHLLTGYVGAVSFLKEIGELVKYLKSVNPELVYGK